MSSSEVLNAACPACGQQGGHIVSLPVDGPVSYKCLQCGNAWELSDTVEGNVRHEIDFKINSIGNGCELLVDGVELKGVRRVSINAQLDYPTTVVVELLPSTLTVHGDTDNLQTVDIS